MAMTQAEKIIWAAAFARAGESAALARVLEFRHRVKSLTKSITQGHLSSLPPEAVLLLEFAEGPAGPGACQKCGSLCRAKSSSLRRPQARAALSSSRSTNTTARRA